MKNSLKSLLSLLLLIGLIAFSFYTHKPHNITDNESARNTFSTARAMQHVDAIAQEPHAVGTPGHHKVREYIAQQLEALGLEVEFQEGLAYTPGWGAMSKATNIVTRLRGSGNGDALLLMSHYDSAPHTASYGASDAGSGVAAILEGLRAYIEEGNQPKNDIIILLTDAEELGLNGASVFVNEHRWAQDVKLALNFEARGSGGPSTMIVETNGGNGALIKAFAKANPSHPYANSLMYSVYKILPNDTDSTVLREGGDIDGFFFAFIGDHFDYHTANDVADRLDPQSLEHQGRYFTSLINYFDSNTLDLKSDEDYVYFNFPIAKMIYYPFSWIWPSVILGFILFFVVLVYGTRKKQLSLKSVGYGFIPFLLSLILAIAWGYAYTLILDLHPKYNEILQGFTYNGYAYIVAWVGITIALFFSVYAWLKKAHTTASLAIAPLFIWLLIATLVAIYLPGAAFFIIPVYFGLFIVLLSFKNSGLFIKTLLLAPSIFIIAHYIKEFPVGLGLTMMPAATLFTVLLLGLFIPVIIKYKSLKVYSLLFAFVGVIFFVNAELNSGFTKENPFPTSLNYVYDVDTNKTFWATYNRTLDPWLKAVLGETPQEASSLVPNVGVGKYKGEYTYATEAPKKPVAPSSIYFGKDEVIEGMRTISFTIYPQREVNDMILLNPQGTPFEFLSFNGKEVKKKETEKYIFENRTTDKLLSYRVSDREPLEVILKVKEGTPVAFTLFDYGYNLLNNKTFGIPPRPEDSMPMPFIYTDAIVTKQTIKF